MTLMSYVQLESEKMRAQHSRRQYIFSCNFIVSGVPWPA